MAKLIIVEGPDNSGKSELVNDICKFNNVKLLKFPKQSKDGQIFKIESRSEVTIFETMLNYLDDQYVYVLDRCYISNMVYEKILRKNETDIYKKDWFNLINTHDVLLIKLTRDYIDFNFEDDLIKLSKTEFNDIIYEYNSIYSELIGPIYNFIIHNTDGTINGIDFKLRNECIKTIKQFIKI